MEDHFSSLGFGGCVIPWWQGRTVRSICGLPLLKQAITFKQRFEPLLKFAFEQIG